MKFLGIDELNDSRRFQEFREKNWKWGVRDTRTGKVLSSAMDREQAERDAAWRNIKFTNTVAHN